MDDKYIAALLFPDVQETPEMLEERYPERELPEGAKVTRFGPSPTGFLHFGAFFPIVASERLAHQSGGVFFLRLEDTDAKREVEGAAENLISTLGYFGIKFDEGYLAGGDVGKYGPYKQRLRGGIYHVYAKALVEKGLAYPCFSSVDELEKIQKNDKEEELKSKDWHGAEEARRLEQEKWRSVTQEEIETSIKEGKPFVLRIKSDGDPDKKIGFTDLVKGKLELSENCEDFVLLKSDGIPTYHFAHAVDDHLMRTTHVIRGEEWLPSLPKHLQLFRYLGFKAPKYLHIAQLMKLVDGSKKKLSKRDMGANMNDYKRIGYPPESVNEYIMTLLNSNYEEWHAANSDKPYTDFPFSIKKMSQSGGLFDFAKLNDVSKNVISKMSADCVYDNVLAWAGEFDENLFKVLKASPEYAKAIFSIGRGGKKPRKDFAAWNEVENYLGFFYDEYFKEGEYPEEYDRQDIINILSQYLSVYDNSDDQNVWFDKIKEIGDKAGYTSDMKLYKANPELYKGSVADVSAFIRIAVTGRQSSPDMYQVMNILGEDKVKARIKAMLEKLRADN